MQRVRRDKLVLAFSMMVFGTIGLVRRCVPFASGTLALFRGALGAAFLLLVRCVRGQRFSGAALRKNLPMLCLSGALIGFNWIALFEAYRFTSVSVATVCYYMAPIFMILASPFVLKEPLTRRKALCVALAFAGMILVSGVLEDGFTGIRGVLFGLAAAVMYAIVILLNKQIHDIDAGEQTLIQLAAAAIALLPYVLLTDNLTALAWTPTILLMTLLAGIFHTGITYLLYFSSIESLPMQTVALFSYIDPVCAVLLSVLVLRESLTPLTAIGCVLVLGATAFSEFGDKAQR